jgi:hypothetical protein
MEITAIDPLGRTEMSWTVVRKRLKPASIFRVLENGTDQVEPQLAVPFPELTKYKWQNEDLIDDNGE